MELPDELEVLLRLQDGIVSRRQLRDCGVGDESVRWALGRRWRMVLPGVVAAFTGRLDEHQRLVAGALYAGEHAVLTGPAASRWHALTSVPRTDYLHFQVPSVQSARSAGPVLVRRTTRPDEHAFWRPPLQIASPARAVADTARLLRTADDVTSLVLESVQRGVTSVPALRHELEAGGRPGSLLLRRALGAAELGVWSLPENGLESALARSGTLPPLMVNPSCARPPANGCRHPTAGSTTSGSPCRSTPCAGTPSAPTGRAPSSGTPSSWSTASRSSRPPRSGSAPTRTGSSVGSRPSTPHSPAVVVSPRSGLVRV